MLLLLKELIATRGVQLLARYGGIGLVALGTKLAITVDPAAAATTSQTLAAFIGAGVLMLIDHFSHAQQQN